MFGFAPFTERGFADWGDIRVFMSGVASINVDFQYRIFVSTREFITRPSDSPSSTPFFGTLKQGFRFDRSLLNGSDIGGGVTGHGQLIISNADGEYDKLPRFYGLDGRRVVVRMGKGSRREVNPYTTFATIFDGTASGMNVKGQRLAVDLRDNGYLLSVPAQPHQYLGTGGIEGTEDAIGKTKPRAFGYVLNVSPPLVLPAKLLYQINDGSVQELSAVYDRGVPLTRGTNYATSTLLLAASVPLNTYAMCLSEGFFRLGSNPQGTVTADVEGDTAGGVFVKDVTSIVRRIVTTAAINDPADLYLPAFNQVALQQPSDIGFWLDSGNTSTVGDVIARLMRSVGGYWAFRRNGKFEIGIITSPSGPPVAEFDTTNIREDSLDRDNLPDSLEPVPWRYRVGYAKNWTVQTDLADSVSADRRAFAAVDLRYAVRESLQAKNNHPLAQEYEPVESFFRFLSDAQTEVDRLALFLSTSRSLYTFDAGLIPFALNLNEVIRVTWPRLDLTFGRLLRIMTLSEDGANNNVKVTGIG